MTELQCRGERTVARFVSSSSGAIRVASVSTIGRRLHIVVTTQVVRRMRLVFCPEPSVQLVRHKPLRVPSTLVISLLAFCLSACSDGFDPSPFPTRFAKLYGTISTNLIPGPPFRYRIATYVDDDCVHGFSAENSGQTDNGGKYNVMLVGTQAGFVACLRVTAFPLTGVDSAVAIFPKGVRLTDSTPTDSQRVDVVIR